MSVNVLFVCLGNICRSPTAHGVFEAMVRREGLEQRIHVDSAGTSGWHIGASADPRSASAAAKRGYDLSSIFARQATADDFRDYDYILAMDCQNLEDLENLKPDDYAGNLGLFLDYSEAFSEREVPDPYYGEGDGFERVLDLIEDAARGLLQKIGAHAGDLTP